MTPIPAHLPRHRGRRSIRLRPFFSLGGVLSAWVPHTTPHVPWLITALGLALLGCWDAIRRGGPLDFILLGLAAYELLIGLTEDQRTSAAQRQKRR